jgi:hypothetical protein
MDFMKLPEFPDHPGSLAAPCELQVVVRAHPTGSSMNGYGCKFTGGHCLPGPECGRKQEIHEEQEKQQLQYEKALREGRVIFKS